MIEWIKRESPILLSGGAVVGFFGAAYLAAKNAPDARVAFDEYEEAETSTQRLWDRAAIFVRFYGPATGLFLLSTAATVASVDIFKKRYGAVSFALTTANSLFSQLEDTVKDATTKKKFDEIVAEANSPMRELRGDELDVPQEGTIVYDHYSDRYFRVDSVETILRAQQDINTRILANDWVPLNDLYFALGLKTIPYGDVLGWHSDSGAAEINISSAMVRNTYTPCVTIRYSVEARRY